MGDMSIPLQFASLYDGQDVFVWSDCPLDLGSSVAAKTAKAEHPGHGRHKSSSPPRNTDWPMPPAKIVLFIRAAETWTLTSLLLYLPYFSPPENTASQCQGTVCFEKDRDRQAGRDRQRDRQAGKQTDRQTDGDRHRDKETERRRERGRVRETERKRERQPARQTNRQRQRQRQRNTEMKRERKSERKRDREKEGGGRKGRRGHAFSSPAPQRQRPFLTRVHGPSS